MFAWAQGQFCQVSPFGVHLVLDAFNIWHVVIEAEGRRGHRRGGPINVDPFVVNFRLEPLKGGLPVIGYNVVCLQK